MRLVEAVCVFFMVLGYSARRAGALAWRAARTVYHEGSDEVARRLRVRGTLALLLIVLLPSGALAAEPWPTLRQFLAFTERQQEDYVRAYMWGAAFALNKSGVSLDGCVAADQSVNEVAGALQALAITAPLEERGRSANHLIGEVLFAGCQFLGEAAR